LVCHFPLQNNRNLHPLAHHPIPVAKHDAHWPQVDSHQEAGFNLLT